MEEEVEETEEEINDSAGRFKETVNRDEEKSVHLFGPSSRKHHSPLRVGHTGQLPQEKQRNGLKRFSLNREFYRVESMKIVDHWISILALF